MTKPDAREVKMRHPDTLALPLVLEKIIAAGRDCEDQSYNIGIDILDAIEKAGFRLAGPDEVVVTWNELDAISTQLFNTIMQGGDWKAGCRKSREMVDALKARAAEEDKV